MSDGPPPPQRDAFAVLMGSATPVCPPDDPWYTAVIYEAHLEHVDESEPLWRVPYIGQVVRAGTAEQNFEIRKHEHETKAAREDKSLGFDAVIGMFGSDKFAWRIVSSKSGRQSEVQSWANTEEIRLIGEHGGLLRDMDAKLTQTLNLTKGGKGDAAKVWAGIEARRRRVFTKFKAAMEAYVEEHGSALVPTSHIDDNGYPLGAKLNDFRHGVMRKGMSDQTHIEAWAEALPKWAWNAKETDEWREGRTQHLKDLWKNATEKQRVAWHKAQKEANNRPEVRAKKSQCMKDWWTNMTEEQKADLRAKTKATIATSESKAKRSKSAKDRVANQLRAELERARTIAVPFVKSKKRRKELRATSAHTKPSGKRGDNVLYMISEDGQTIRRVDTEGTMAERNIVGPVVDPAPPDAYVSDSESD